MQFLFFTNFCSCDAGVLLVGCSVFFVAVFEHKIDILQVLSSAITFWSFDKYISQQDADVRPGITSIINNIFPVHIRHLPICLKNDANTQQKNNNNIYLKARIRLGVCVHVHFGDNNSLF